ncbi:TPA: hypothetical protein EYO12_02085 [Candidatus Saccharibacteria bacterium]|nr:hypothetical protein [Candidatus Saccharibacteria bacterium]HIO87507.1 hypothetical protein [Candidatus Saccharibacteria bacterium]
MANNEIPYESRTLRERLKSRTAKVIAVVGIAATSFMAGNAMGRDAGYSTGHEAGRQEVYQQLLPHMPAVQSEAPASAEGTALSPEENDNDVMSHEHEIRTGWEASGVEFPDY